MGSDDCWRIVSACCFDDGSRRASISAAAALCSRLAARRPNRVEKERAIPPEEKNHRILYAVLLADVLIIKKMGEMNGKKRRKRDHCNTCATQGVDRKA